ncbi:MAG: nitrogen fixation protein NifQ [Oxalobacteraceae bacterium]|nr:nitrogen fixation protein NifQ [Oxalobacteraceae bacterium]
MTQTEVGYVELIEAARHPEHVVTLAFAGLIALAPQRPSPYDVPIAALDDAALAAIRERYFPDLQCPLKAYAGASPPQSIDEFEDLLAMLLEHRSVADQEGTWLAHAVATACMGANHLWQDMGLPNRAALSMLIKHHFTSLAERNSGDMKWKKFFYRQLCEREGLLMCNSPSCGNCSDYLQCFGPEDATSFFVRDGGPYLA